MLIPDSTIVLACLTPPSIWDFYDDFAIAQSRQQEVNDYNAKLEQHGAPPRHYEPMTYGAYKSQERDFYLAAPATEITAKQFEKALNVLSPMKWRRTAQYESFLISEFWSGNYTSQYIKVGKRYWEKFVDAHDPTTWMTEEIAKKH